MNNGAGASAGEPETPSGEDVTQQPARGAVQASVEQLGSRVHEAAPVGGR